MRQLSQGNDRTVPRSEMSPSLTNDNSNSLVSHEPPPTGINELDKKDEGDDVERSESLPDRKVDEAPPEGGYGWVCLISVFVINAHTWGINSTYGVFLNFYLGHNFFANTNYLTYAFVGGLSVSQAVFCAPLATWVVHHYGTRVCLHIGIFLQTLSLIGVSFAREKYQLILAQGFCFGYGIGFLFVASVGIIPQWFLKKRSLANAIAAGGSGAGGLTYSLATQRMIDTLGLPWAFRILGIVSMVMNLIASNLVRDRNRRIGSRTRPFDHKLLKRPEFVLLQVFGWFSMLGYIVILFSLPDFATSVGLSAKQGSIVAAVLNTGQMIVRPIIGLTSDRYGRLNTACIATALCGLSCFAFWIPARGMGLLCFFALFGGGLSGTFWGVAAPVTAEVVGLKDLPAGLSITWLMLTPPTTVAEAIGLELRKKTGSIYLNAQVFTGIMYITAALCLWLVRAWKVGEIEELSRLEKARSRGTGASRLEGEKAIEASGSQAVLSDTIPEDDVRSVAMKSWQSNDLVRRLFAVSHV